jgi:type IV pilus assembly protein PilM
MAKINKGKSLIGLDIGSRWIKALEVAPTDAGLGVISLARVELTPQKNLKEALQEIMVIGGFKTKKVVTAVSGRSVIVRYITMPYMKDDEELKSALKYEISKYIPFEAEEVITDCVRIENLASGELPAGSDARPAAGTANANEMQVLLVAVKKDAIEEHITLLENSGFWPTVIDVDSFALGNAYELYYELSKSTDNATQVKALVDIGASKTNINILAGNKSSFTREVYIAGNDFTEAITKKMGLELLDAEALKRDPGLKVEEIKEVTSTILEDLCHEIHLSFDYFEHQFEKPIEGLYISGGGAQLSGLAETFERMFEKKVVHWDPTEFLEVASDKFTPADLRGQGNQLAIAVGLASRILEKT